MGNCIVTRLKGAVAADLPYFDGIRVEVDWNKGGISSLPIKVAGSYTGANAIRLHFGAIGTRLKVLSNGDLVVNNVSVGTEHEILANTHAINLIPVDAGEKTVILFSGLGTITNFYTPTTNEMNAIGCDDMPALADSGLNFKNISVLNACSEKKQDLSVLEYIPNKSSVNNIYVPTNGGLVGNIRYLSMFPNLLTIINVARYHSDVYGDISSIAGLTNLTSISLRNNDNITGLIDSLAGLASLATLDLQATSVRGNIASLGACTSLTTLTLSSTSVTGAVEDLVAGFRAAGRTSGTLTATLTRTAVTYDGNVLTKTVTITWTASSISVV